MLVAALLVLPSARAHGQGARIVEWVEDSASIDSSRIALGYPVPNPVDTPLPFDGFRSYSGLHARHQDLAATTPWVHAVPLGSTRGGRTIWLYQLGDADHETVAGLPEQAMLTNAGIHAREWQSQEVATGIMELLALSEDDRHLLSYLRENANMLVIPVLNVDGFLQTQRYSATNWLGTDPTDPEASPRDGRMRRKNMLGADEDLETSEDHLLGVDLNRNNRPYWNTNPTRSSGNSASLVYHGAAPQSEPEIQAVDAAAQLGPASQLSMYTDLHSFSQVHLWERSSNYRLTRLTERLLATFSGFHRNFPAGKNYAYSAANNTPLNAGIGTTDEYFTQVYGVPSWTLEIEPSNGASYHAPLPGAGADYGGLGRNSHDGFILPESEVERVRTELAQTFAVAYYRQSGPPSISALHIVDIATGAVVFLAEWSAVDSERRQLHVYQPQSLQLDRDYRAWIAWDKPMRWRIDSTIAVLPGQAATTLDVSQSLTVAENQLHATIGTPIWLAQAGASPGGYRRYRDDAMVFDLRIQRDESSQALADAFGAATLHVEAYDFTGNRSDANPATVARWARGAWAGYEDSDGNDQNDAGGSDSTLEFSFTSGMPGDPFTIEAGTSAAWYDPERSGEGFMLEILPASRAVMYWFTYDTEGRQDWYAAQGEVIGNRLIFPQLLRVSGGEFGPGFDPGKVTRTPVGSASFIWSSCDEGAMSWVIDGDGGGRRQGRMNLIRLSRIMGIDCGEEAPTPEPSTGSLSGSWYDPSHSGEGYVLEILADHRALVYWFSFDSEGQRRWFFGTGQIAGDSFLFEDIHSTSGGVFGPAYDPQSVVLSPWGSLRLDLGCDNGAASFEPVEAGFPAGRLELVRLTRLQGPPCED